MTAEKMVAVNFKIPYVTRNDLKVRAVVENMTMQELVIKILVEYLRRKS
jgi:hypothetical protein